MKYTQADKDRALESIKSMFPQGSKLYGIEHRSTSGMSARYRLVAITKSGEVYHPTWGVGAVVGRSMVEKQGQYWIKVNGCGYNRLQAIADELSVKLYGKEGMVSSEAL